MSDSINQVEMMQYIKQTAKEAAEETGKLVRAEVRGDLLEMKDEIKKELCEVMREELASEMKSHFGNMTPCEHTSQHKQMSDYIDTLKEVKKSWIKKLLDGFIVVSLVGVIGYGILIALGPAILSSNKAASNQSIQTNSEPK